MKAPEKRILFIITHLELGGAQKQLLTLIRNLDHSRYRLYLCAGDYGYLKEEFLNLPNLKVKPIKELVRNINPLYDVIAFLKIYLYIKKNKFDIIHTHSPKASFLGRWAAFLAKTRNIIYTVHGWPFHKFMNPLSYHLYLYLERLTAKITKRIIVVSNADLAIGIKKKIAGPDKLFLIHYGVDIKLWEDIFLKRKQSLSSKNLVVNVSSLKPQKDLASFLEMVRLVLDKKSQLKFSIIGDGPLKRYIQKTIRKKGLQNHISLEGWNKDISPAFCQASLVVLTSLWEGLPLVIIEAVIAGIPVVVTDTGGVLDIVENLGNGIVVGPKRIKELYQAVINILDNYNEWTRRIENHRKSSRLSYWSQERMIEETKKLYHP
jgi:glycosyltransferase involved in cell wall biosynthesis